MGVFYVEATVAGIKEEIIGNCRLILGDCREVLPTLPKVDAVITDPPYGILSAPTGGRGNGAGKLKNRSLNKDKCEWDIAPSNDLLEMIIAHGSESLIWGGNYFDLPPCRGFLIWDKLQPWPNFSAAEFAWSTIDRPSAIFKISSSLGDKGHNNTHPTVKPLELMLWTIAQFKNNPQSILDPFMGSGTTGVACAQMGRKFIGIEREQKYFDIACRRIEDAYRQPRLIMDEQPIQEQGAMFGGNA